MTERLPPQNIEAERSTLGSLLVDKDAVVRIAEFLKPDHFYKDIHGLIFEAILSLYEKREPADIVTLSNELEERKILEKIGGVSYLTELVESVPTSAHIEYYAKIVRDHFTRRRLIQTASKITELSFESDRDTVELLDESEQALFGISQDHLRQAFVPLKDVLAKSFDRLDELHKKSSSIRGIPTGFRSLDNKLAGLQDSNMIVLAARPSQGKTSLALNIAQHVAVREKQPVGFFSLESSKEELVDRLLASEADVDGWKIKTGRLDEEDFTSLGEAMGKLAEAPLFIDDTPGMNIMEMRTKARRLQMEKGLRLIIVDYLQLAHARNLENRVQEVSEISRALKDLARELKSPVLAVSQLSRAVESRQAKIPQLSDLRESGSIEQDADVVMFLYKEDPEQPDLIKLLIAKHRNGPTGTLDLIFRAEKTRFYEMEKGREE